MVGLLACLSWWFVAIAPIATIPLPRPLVWLAWLHVAAGGGMTY